MSTEVSAVFFYGAPVPQSWSEADMDSLERSSLLGIGAYGCGGAGTIPYVYVRESQQEAGLGSCARVTDRGFVPSTWRATLYDFFERHEIPWPEGGAGWYFAARSW